MSLPNQKESIITQRPPFWLLVSLPLLSSLCIDMYLPAYPQIAHDYGVNAGAVNLSMSVYLVGLSLGQLIYGPLADRWGRRPTLLLGLALFCLASFICAIATTFTLLLVARTLQAVGACSAFVINRAIIMDVYPAHQRAPLLACIAAANIVSPLLAPLVGGGLMLWFGWHSIFTSISLAGILLWLGTLLVLSETLPAPVPLRLTQWRNNLSTVGKSRIFIGHTLSIALLYAADFIWVTSSPHIVLQKLHASPQQFGLFFLFPASGFTLGALMSAYLQRFYSPFILLRQGYLLLISAGLLFLGISLANTHAPIAIMLPIILIFMGIGFVQPLQIALAMAPFTRIAGFASGLLGAIQTIFGALIAVMTGLLYQAPLTQLALLMLSILGCSYLGYYLAMLPDNVTLKINSSE